MTNLISMQKHRDQKALGQAFARGRKPLFLEPKSYVRSATQLTPAGLNAFDKIKNIRDSIQEINRSLS